MKKVILFPTLASIFARSKLVERICADCASLHEMIKALEEMAQKNLILKLRLRYPIRLYREEAFRWDIADVRWQLEEEFTEEGW